LRNNQQTNNIVITASHRFDLNDNSRVNEEIRKFNISLINVVNNLNEVPVVKAEMDRGCYTRHCMYYNRKGKKIMAKQIITIIQEIIMLQSENVMIPLIWEKTSHELTNQLI
jgi:hypothetical protein